MKLKNGFFNPDFFVGVRNHKRLALGVGKKGCMIASLYWSTGTLLIMNRILLSKLLFVYHIANLPDNCLAKEFYLKQVQNRHKYPSVVKEVLEILEKWNIDLNCYYKYQYKRLIKSKVFSQNRDQLLEMIKGYKKMNYEECLKEKFEMKEHFYSLNIQDSRMCFRMKNFLVPTVKSNFKNDKKFKASKWLCDDCSVTDGTTRGSMDSQDHILNHCPANEDLRKGLNLQDNKDCVKFFQQVIQRRKNKLNLA